SLMTWGWPPTLRPVAGLRFGPPASEPRLRVESRATVVLAPNEEIERSLYRVRRSAQATLLGYRGNGTPAPLGKQEKNATSRHCRSLFTYRSVRSEVSGAVKPSGSSVKVGHESSKGPYER